MKMHLNPLTAFMNIAYRKESHSSGMVGHFFNDTEFFSEFYALTLRPDADFVDVGFNIGMQADIVLELTKGNIYGFEASKKIYEYSARKFAKEPRVKLFNEAVFDAPGEMEFFDTENWGTASLAQTNGVIHHSNNSYDKTIVQLIRLDDRLADQNNIGAMKLDIEGAELPALDGSLALIQRNRPFICMEYCDHALHFALRGKPISAETLYHFAKEIDYRVYNIYGICLSDIDVWNASIFKDTSDVYLIPSEQHERWCDSLLPKYQYRILEKFVFAIEQDSGGHGIFLASLPAGQIYPVVNVAGAEDSKKHLLVLREQIRRRVENPADIGACKNLTPRGKVLLTLIHAGEIDAAYALACIKSVSPEMLVPYMQLCETVSAVTIQR